MGIVLKNRYELVEQIGRGGMAEIFRARIRGPHGFEKEVCIKRILPLLSSHPGFEAMFLDEARIAATLRHAGIVQVFDFDRDEEGHFFIVMELVDGVNLKAVMLRAAEKHEPLEPGFAVALGRSVLQALHHAWTREVEGRSLKLVHRDLSPHNILISREGEIKITDFGIAKAITSAVKTREGVIKGKLAYMSPEHAEGRGVDGRSDLYALGVVLWEVLAGERLFGEAGDRKRPPSRDERRDIAPLHALRQDIGEPLSRWVLRLLAPEPAARPPSALHALEELEGLGLAPLSGLGITRMLDRLGCLEAPRVPPQPERRSPTDSLSPPQSGSTLEPAGSTVEPEGPTPEPVGAGSTASISRTPSSVPRRSLKPALILMLLGAALVGVVGLLTLHFQGRGPAAVTEREAAPDGLEVRAAAGAQERAAGVEIPTAGEGAAAPIAKGPQEKEDGAARDTEGDAQPEKTGKGWLTINVKPWAEVMIDGKPAGFTPLHRRPLAAGTHSIVVRNPKLGKVKGFLVKIKEKKVKTLTFDFTH